MSRGLKWPPTSSLPFTASAGYMLARFHPPRPPNCISFHSVAASLRAREKKLENNGSTKASRGCEGENGRTRGVETPLAVGKLVIIGHLIIAYRKMGGKMGPGYRRGVKLGARARKYRRASGVAFSLDEKIASDSFPFLPRISCILIHRCECVLLIPLIILDHPVHFLYRT